MGRRIIVSPFRLPHTAGQKAIKNKDAAGGRIVGGTVPPVNI